MEINTYLLENLGYGTKELSFALVSLLLIASSVMALILYPYRAISGGFLAIIIGALYLLFPTLFFDVTAIYVLFPAFVIGGLGAVLLMDDKLDNVWDVPFATNKGKRIIKNIKRGVIIIGAAGSGKTESPIYVLLKHMADKLFTGIIYDFKDGELIEISRPLFGNRLKVIAFHNPHMGIRVNPISQKYIKDEKDINEIVAVLIQNLGSGEKPNFFSENAQALLAGIILKLHLSDIKNRTNYCTLPHVIAIILTGDFEESTFVNGQEIIEPYGKLKTFLSGDERVKMQASAFLSGLSSERQTASVYSTLANLLRKLAFGECFYTLSDDDIDLAVNKFENDIVIAVVNEPKNDNYLSPVIATIIHTITKQMMVRDRKHSAILLDEAPTIKLMNMARIPATMRSFGVSTIYCMQDLVQGSVQYTREGIKEIVSNLSIQFFGKTNDSETSRFYEGFFGMKMEKTVSKNYKGDAGGLFGSMNGSNIGEREVRETRAIEFHRLKAGEFAFLSDGKGGIIKFNRLKIEREKDIIVKVEKDVIDKNFYKILNDVKFILNSKL